LAELDVDLIKARSPQAKGRVERFFGTAQDRWVKELRLAKAKTVEQANAVLERLVPEHNRRFSVPAGLPADAHRRLGSGHNLAAILSIQEQRVVANDYTVRLENRLYQLDKPIYPGERGGKVVIELRLDGTMAVRLGNRYLKYHEITRRGKAAETREEASSQEASSPGSTPTNGRSGRTPAEPYPPVDEREDSKKGPWRPAANHPWRRGFLGKNKKAKPR
jgi:hypothetical protein